MTVSFEKNVREAKKEVRKTETWHTEIDGYAVVVSHTDGYGAPYEIGIVPNHWDDFARLPLLHFYPKNVADLDRLAEILPSVLRQLAEAMRTEGLEDLRSDADKHRDDWQEQMRQMRAPAVRAGG